MPFDMENGPVAIHHKPSLSPPETRGELPCLSDRGLEAAANLASEADLVFKLAARARE